jgi:integrase
MRVSERINDHLREVGVAGAAHQLRHRFGTKLYEATRDPFLVATFMGHASIDTTKGYVRISPHAAALPVEQVSRLAVAAELDQITAKLPR